MRSTKPISDLPDYHEYIYRVREVGDKKAFEVIFRAFHQRLYGFAKTLVNCSDTSEDIIQSVFLNIWVNRSTWNPEGEGKEYHLTSLKKECRNVLRHKKKIDQA